MEMDFGFEGRRIFLSCGIIRPWERSEFPPSGRELVHNLGDLDFLVWEMASGFEGRRIFLSCEDYPSLGALGVPALQAGTGA